MCAEAGDEGVGWERERENDGQLVREWQRFQERSASGIYFSLFGLV